MFDPNIAFGRPVVVRADISTGSITERIYAGETVSGLIEDYGLSREEIKEPALYESGA